MAQETEFTHDELGHLLADHLLRVPRFQRSYSWTKSNVEEFLADLTEARSKKVSYFMGTVVFAHPQDDGDRRQIVDGQQRLATTAILIVAIQDLLLEYGKEEQSRNTRERYLQGYVLAEEGDVERLILSHKDQEAYDALLDGLADSLPADNPLRVCYETCRTHLQGLAPTAAKYRELLQVVDQLEKKVQVLVAVASDLPEAYVIFETLNDRGADLTTADLLKNYLFSQAKSHFDFVEAKWSAIESSFDSATDLVKFIRHEYIARHGSVRHSKLYRAIQHEIGSPAKARQYVKDLSHAQTIYLAVKDPDNAYWNDVNLEVRDALLAYRRFGFESSLPVLIAAFRTLNKTAAARLMVKLISWSVRGQFAGRIGANLSEGAFGEAAKAITAGEASTQPQIRRILVPLIPTNTELKAAFSSYGSVSAPRAKYLLAMLDKAQAARAGKLQQPLDWSARSVTIEHVNPKSETSNEEIAPLVETIGNMALLEKSINHDLGSRPFTEKRSHYSDSTFLLTAELADEEEWTAETIEHRTATLAALACEAWPAQ